MSQEKNLKVLILLPFLNEEKHLPRIMEDLSLGFGELERRQCETNKASRFCRFELLLCDSGSEDNSLELAESFCHKLGHSCLLQTYPSAKNLSDLLKQVIMESGHFDYYWVIPSDMRIPIEAFSRVEQMLLSSPSIELLGFKKYYKNADVVMRLYAGILNFLGKYLGLMVWTNALVVKKSLFQSVLLSSGGFLDDLRLAQSALRSRSWTLLHEPKVGVSARRYRFRGFYRQLFINFCVLWGFYLGKKDAKTLKRFYDQE